MGSLIINADDLGISSNVNHAILYCLDKGIINSASIMVNMPGFEEAVNIVKEKGYSHCIGVHVNLTEGKPLTEFNHSLYLNKDGTWNQESLIRYRLQFDRIIKRDFSNEILAQIKAVQDKGIRPTHINSHHHVHTLPSLFPLFFTISRLFGYKLRIAQTYSSGNYLKSIYRKVLNNRIKRSGLQFSDYFETIDSYRKRKKIIGNGLSELMVHPAFDKNGSLIDTFDRRSLNLSFL